MKRRTAAPHPSLKFLYGLERFGIKLGLNNIRSLTAYLGHPERCYPTIHIAGTNGKGSTASMIASMLTAAGYRTGLYTSPHLVDFRERIRIDGEMIPGRALSSYTGDLRREVIRTRATFFEATTAIAFRHFADQKVDVAVIETGLGGRFDATNVLTPVLSIITSIGRDHIAQLGNTIPAIAFEKAGIIKPSTPVLVGPVDRSAMSVLSRVAKDLNAPLSGFAERSMEYLSGSIEGSCVSLSSELMSVRHLEVSLAGDFQLPNIALALTAAGMLRKRGLRIPSVAVREGMANIRRNTGLRGRLETVRRDPLTILDVAHNGDAMLRLSRSLGRLLPGKYVVIFGLMKDKEAEPFISALRPLTRLAVVVRPQTPRAADPRALVSCLHNLGMRAIVGGSVREGWSEAGGFRRDGEPILVTGSHYVVGEFIEILK